MGPSQSRLPSMSSSVLHKTSSEVTRQVLCWPYQSRPGFPLHKRTVFCSAAPALLNSRHGRSSNRCCDAGRTGTPLLAGIARNWRDRNRSLPLRRQYPHYDRLARTPQDRSHPRNRSRERGYGRPRLSFRSAAPAARDLAGVRGWGGWWSGWSAGPSRTEFCSDDYNH